MPSETWGDFRVSVIRDGEDVLSWDGYAENITDALYKAMNKHEESLWEKEEKNAE